MLDASDSQLLDAVRSVRWPARRIARGGVTGAHLSRTLGTSAEFTEYRAYRQGDETRRIDWKLLARTDRAYIRLAQDHTLLPTMVLLDASASMAYPQDTLEKWHHARQVALGLAAASYQGGDPVGLLAVEGAQHHHKEVTRRLAARTRRGVVHEIAGILRQVTPVGSVALAGHLLALRNSRRIAIVCDFLGDMDALLKVAGGLCAEGKEVYAIHVIHARELNPSREAALLRDPENSHLLRPMVDATRTRYQERFAEWCETLAREWIMRGAYYARAVTSEPAPFAVRRITKPGMTEIQSARADQNRKDTNASGGSQRKRNRG